MVLRPGLILTATKSNNPTREMPSVLEAQGLALLGSVPDRVDYQRAFGEPIPDKLLEPYRAILEEVGVRG